MTAVPNEPRGATEPRPRSGLIPGGLAGALGVVSVMPFFYPLGRVFDPGVGGDQPTGLMTELMLGLIGGIVLSPIAAAMGAGVGRVIGVRPVGPVLGLSLVMLAAAVAGLLMVALNGGPTDELDGSLNGFVFVVTLGAMAGSVAVTVFELLRRSSLASER